MMIAAPERPLILLIGDGAFQMTCQELSSIIRYGCRPTIYLVNNRGYTIERVLHEGPYNDIQNWRYTSIPFAFGAQNDDGNNLEAKDSGKQQTCCLTFSCANESSLNELFNPPNQQIQFVNEQMAQQQQLAVGIRRASPGDAFRFVEIKVPKDDFPPVMKNFVHKIVPFTEVQKKQRMEKRNNEEDDQHRIRQQDQQQKMETHPPLTTTVSAPYIEKRQKRIQKKTGLESEIKKTKKNKRGANAGKESVTKSGLGSDKGSEKVSGMVQKHKQVTVERKAFVAEGIVEGED
jgi:hypothetical protein